MTMKIIDRDAKGNVIDLSKVKLSTKLSKQIIKIKNG